MDRNHANHDDDDYDSGELAKYKKQLKTQKSFGGSKRADHDIDELAQYMKQNSLSSGSHGRQELFLEKVEEARQYQQNYISALKSAETSNTAIEKLAHEISEANTTHKREMLKLDLNREIAGFERFVAKASAEFEAYKNTAHEIESLALPSQS